VIATVVCGERVETVRARWLIGCDGGRSVVRTGAGIAFVGETRDDARAALADLPL
jgi:2-polyprenyl-6-methoxyphenol hydroxylase-like FAD-dependent oxidoreductase